jgi:hypothetical protein
MRRNPSAVTALWLFLLSSFARRNGVLAISLWRRRQRRPRHRVAIDRGTCESGAGRVCQPVPFISSTSL